MEEKHWDIVSDSYLAERIRRSNCERSLIELIGRHSGLCFKIMTRYTKSFYANNIDIAEASTDKNLIIWNSAKSFSAEKNVKFSTWLANQVKYSCLNALNKKSKDRLVMMEDQVLENLKGTQAEDEKDTLFEFTDNILSQLKDERIKKIFSMRYSRNHKKPSWCVVAQRMKVSTQTAINLHNRGIQILRKKIESEKFLDSV